MTRTEGPATAASGSSFLELRVALGWAIAALGAVALLHNLMQLL